MPAKQAIKDKLQDSVATYLRCGGVVNKQIKKGLLLSLWLKKIKIGEYLNWQNYGHESVAPFFGPSCRIKYTSHSSQSWILLKILNIDQHYSTV